MLTHYTEPTTSYWQKFLNYSDVTQISPPWQYRFPVRLPNGRYLMLPIRQLASDLDHAVASLLVNAASLEVVDELARMLATELKPFRPDVVVGLPTLGHALCPGITRALGHSRYVVGSYLSDKSYVADLSTHQPLGYSKKFWYESHLSTPVSSITSPELGQKRLWIDPHQLPLLKDRRVAIVDDAISSGTTMLAAWQLLESLGADVVVCGVAMKQGSKWKTLCGEDRTSRVVGVFDSPLLERTSGGWTYRI